MSKQQDHSHRTLELMRYILSEQVTFDSTEFIPKQAVMDVLQTTAPTIRQRIKDGELREKTFFLTLPVRKTYLGLEIGGVKKLLVKKLEQKQQIEAVVNNVAQQGELTSYADIMELAGMKWQSPPDRKYCNKVLKELSELSYQATIDSGHPCLISSVVVSRNEGLPTQSYFDLAIELGLLDVSDTEEDKKEFWQHQLELVHNYYGN